MTQDIFWDESVPTREPQGWLVGTALITAALGTASVVYALGASTGQPEMSGSSVCFLVGGACLLVLFFFLYRKVIRDSNKFRAVYAAEEKRVRAARRKLFETAGVEVTDDDFESVAFARRAANAKPGVAGVIPAVYGGNMASLVSVQFDGEKYVLYGTDGQELRGLVTA